MNEQKKFNAKAQRTQRREEKRREKDTDFQDSQDFRK
jgi:hypothetical protein